MDIDSGNFASVVTVQDDRKSEIGIEVELEKNDTSLEPSQSSGKELPENADGSAQSATIPAEDEPPKLPFSNARLTFLVITVTGASFLNTLGAQAAVIILPSIGRDLDIPDSRQQWVVSSYALTFGCFLLLWGRLADVYGKRRIFILGSAWLTAISLIVPFAPDEITFDLFRGFQGLGAAANVPTALGILGTTFTPSKAKNYAFACYGAGAPLGAVFGNLLGGVVGEYVTWKWVFWVLSVIAAIVTLGGIFIIPSQPKQARNLNVGTSVDWIGGAIITIGLLTLMFALTEGNVVGWSTPYIPVLIIISILIIAIFVTWQWYLETMTSRRPLMKISIFKNLRFSAALMIMLLFFASFNNYLIFATYYFQSYQGLSVIQTTLRFVPTGVVGVITSFIMAHLLSRVRGNILLMWANSCVAISNLLFAIPIPPHTTYWAYGFPAMVLSVFGADTIWPTLTLFASKSLPQEDQAVGGGLINAVGQLGRSIGLAIATAIETAVIAREMHVDVKEVGSTMKNAVGSLALLKGLRAAYWVGFAYAVAAFGVVAFAFRGAGKVGAINKS